MITFIAGVMLIFSLIGCDTGNGPDDSTGKTPLGAPVNVRVDPADFTFKWDAVSNAEAYTVDIDGTVETVSVTELPLKRLTSDPKVYTLKVKALSASGSTSYSDSAYSAPLNCEVADYIFEYDGGIEAQSSVIRFARNIEPYNQTAGLTITGLTDYGKTLVNIVIPEKIGNVTITVIGNSAFKDAAIVSVVIPATVAEIGDSAFKGTTIVAVVIPESVTGIGSGAFSEIATLTEVVFKRSAGDGVTELGEGVFDGSDALETIIVPEGSGEEYAEKIAESSPDIAERVEVNETQPGAYVIKVDTGNGGTITTSPQANALAGKTVTIYVSPDQGYTMASLSITNSSTGQSINYQQTANGFTFTMPSSNVAISGTFSGGTPPPEAYVIKVEAGNSGTITTNPQESAPAGTTVWIYVSPDQGYTMASLSVTNSSTGQAINYQQIPNGFTFTMPSSNVAISGTFSISGGGQSYSITTYENPPSVATITTNPSGNAPAGTTVTITVSPDINLGFQLASLSVTNQSNNNAINYQTSSIGAVYTFTMPASDVFILGYFSTSGSGYKITTSVVPVVGGTITTNPQGNAAEGTIVTVYVSPNINQGYTYNSSSLTITNTNGGAVNYQPTDDGGSYTFTMPATDVTITGTFSTS
jgi:hypothetical protein